MDDLVGRIECVLSRGREPFSVREKRKFCSDSLTRVILAGNPDNIAVPAPESRGTFSGVIGNFMINDESVASLSRQTGAIVYAKYNISCRKI